MNRIRVTRIAFYGWAALLLTLTSIPHVPWNGPDGLGIDKVAHFIFYAVLALFFVLMRSAQGQAHKVHRELLLLMLFFPIFDETHQLFIPGRQFSLYDLAADLIGMVIVLILCHKSLRRSPYGVFRKEAI